mgnify:CR=1 FL=1
MSRPLLHTEKDRPGKGREPRRRRSKDQNESGGFGNEAEASNTREASPSGACSILEQTLSTDSMNKSVALVKSLGVV